jgi:Tol biopolymer transport system component
MTAERWRSLMPLLDHALGLTPEDRAAWLADLESRNPGLAPEIQSLLRQHAALTEAQFLEGPLDVPPGALAGSVAISMPFQAGDVIGSCRLLQPLGSGGMGVVWLAQQEGPIRRLVALKIARPGPVPREIIARLEVERQAQATLDHPGIATVFEAGSTRGGVPYFAMEYIKGAPITDYCDARALSLAERLRLFADVCDAVHHAHLGGVLHRDLKPSNILVSEQGDRHIAKIIDFGIAKTDGNALAGDSLHTQVGAILGTPAYMSPEQAGVIDAPVDARSDLYSLGVILYELLSGEVPGSPGPGRHRHVSRALRTLDDEVPAPAAWLARLEPSRMETIARDRSITPAALRRQLAGELQWIVARAVRRAPAERYPSVAALRADIARHIDGLPIEARPPSIGHRVRRLVRRNRPAVTASLVLPVAVASGALVSSMRQPDEIAVRPTPVSATAASSMPLPLTSFPGIEADPAWSPDGREIAFIWNGAAQDDFDIYVLRHGETQPRRLTTEPGPDVNPAWSPDGQWIAYDRPSTGPGFSSIHLVSASGRERRMLLRRATPVGGAAWSRDSRSLILQMVRTSRRVADLWAVSIDSGVARRITRAPDDSIGDIEPALSPDGRTLAFCRKTAWRTAELYLLDVTPDLKPRGAPRRVTQLGFVDRPVWTPDGSRLVFEASGNGAGLWQLELATGQVSPVLGPSDTATQPALVKGPTGDTALAFTNQLAEVAIWRYSLREPAAAPVELVPSTRPQSLPQYSNDGRRLAFSSTRSGSQEIWIAGVDGAGLRQVTALRHPLTEIGHWSPDDQLLTFVTQARGSRRLYVIDPSQGEPVPITPPDVVANGWGWSRDGRFYYFTSTATGQREVWRAERPTWSLEQVTFGGGDAGFESGRGTFYYWSVADHDSPQLRRRDATRDEELRIDPAPHSAEGIVPSPTGFYYRAAGTADVFHYDETAGRSSLSLRLPEPFGRFTISPGGDFFATAFRERHSVDLMVIERFR